MRDYKSSYLFIDNYIGIAQVSDCLEYKAPLSNSVSECQCALKIKTLRQKLFYIKLKDGN